MTEKWSTIKIIGEKNGTRKRVAQVENLHAMIDTGKQYGKYKLWNIVGPL
jgi:hypothetical protein